MFKDGHNYPWYFFNGSRSGQRLGSSLPVGAAKRQRSVPSRSKLIAMSAPGSMKSSWSQPVQSGMVPKPIAVPGWRGAMKANQANMASALWLISDVDPWYLT